MRGATTVEWVVLAMVLGVAMTVVWQQLRTRIGGTVARGGDCVLALDGSCAGAAAIAAPSVSATPPASGPSGVVPIAAGLPVGAAVGSSSLTWGTPGFTQGWTPEERERYLAEHGVADPAVEYWTPFWEHLPPNYYTGSVDTGARNTFGTIHDYNIARDDWGWIGDYLDVVTPLTGRTHDDIDDGAARAWQSLRDALGL